MDKKKDPTELSNIHRVTNVRRERKRAEIPQNKGQENQSKENVYVRRRATNKL